MASNNQSGNQGGNQGGGNQGGNQGGQSGSQGDTSNRGFASMDKDRQREIASEGGKAAHESGNANEFSSEEAREAGRKAVQAVAGGATFFSKPVQALLWASVNQGAPSGIAGLTAREVQVFLRLASGQTVSEIAKALSLTDVTISSHRAHVLEKLQLTSNSHLTRYAIDNHFLK